MIPGKLPPRTHIIPPVQGRYSTSPLSVKHTNTRMGGGGVVLPLAQKQRWKCDFFFSWCVMCGVCRAGLLNLRSTTGGRKWFIKCFFPPSIHLFPFIRGWVEGGDSLNREAHSSVLHLQLIRWKDILFPTCPGSTQWPPPSGTCGGTPRPGSVQGILVRCLMAPFDVQE